MRYTVSSREFIPEPGQTDPTMRKLQRVAVLLGTAKGSAPMARDFGIPCYDGYPLSAAKTLLRAAITEAMEAYIPEVQLVSIDFSEDAATGTLTANVEVEV